MKSPICTYALALVVVWMTCNVRGRAETIWSVEEPTLLSGDWSTPEPVTDAPATLPTFPGAQSGYDSDSHPLDSLLLESLPVEARHSTVGKRPGMLHYNCQRPSFPHIGNVFQLPRVIANMHSNYWDCQDAFCERPLGTWMRAQMNTQVINGMAAQMAFYHYDFYVQDGEHATTLTPRGRAQLLKMANVLAQQRFPVMVEGTGDPTLDRERRRQIFSELSRLSLPISEEQIVTGIPVTAGMTGLEAFDVYQNLLEQTQSQGADLGAGGLGIGGGAVGSGLSISQ